jgi:hypothetical protein
MSNPTTDDLNRWAAERCGWTDVHGFTGYAPGNIRKMIRDDILDYCRGLNDASGLAEKMRLQKWRVDGERDLRKEVEGKVGYTYTARVWLNDSDDYCGGGVAAAEALVRACYAAEEGQ